MKPFNDRCVIDNCIVILKNSLRKEGIKLKRWFLTFFSFIIVVTLLISFLHPARRVNAEESNLVYVVPIEFNIERGLEQFLTRAFKEAEEASADYIILEIDTLGGAVDAATNIGQLIQNEEIPVIAYIKGEAISAGSYISLNADKIFMQPNSHIGAAAVRTISGEEADPKVVSWWVSHMKDAAEVHGRNEEIAQGMVDANVVIPGITKKGDLITLNTNQALKYKMIDGVAETRDDVLTSIGLTEANTTILEIEPQLAERIARFATNPVIIPILLILGLGGIVIELIIPGFGFPGLIGIFSFGLYFFGHLVAGFAGWEDIIFFVIGIILLVIEIFVPSFGILGISGIISVIVGIVLASYQTSYGIYSLAIAVLVNIVVISIMVKYFGHRGIWNKFILKDEQKNESGYVSHNKDKQLIGKIGTTFTKLRPSGTVIIADERYDVVSEGEWIQVNQLVQIVKIEGTRIVVRPYSKNEE